MREMILTPWYKIATPREDLREGIPLDASEFAIHLDQVVDGRAPINYRNPARFFSRQTHLTGGLLELTAEVVRRLSGESIRTSAVIILTTQFGGGKTHTLTALYHLVNNGKKSVDYPGVSQLIKEVGFIHENLNKIVEDARNRFNEDGFVGKFIISADMKPGDIWSALEKIEDQDFFIEQFNILEEEIRKAVAEHVLTQCNVFSGKGATFSARYNEQTKCME